MKIHSFFWFPAVLASLAFATSVKAEEVSTKAADLMGVSTDNHNTSNLLAQSSDGFTPLTPTPSSTTPLYTSGDINPDLPASNYPYGSLSVGFGSQSNVDLKVIGVKAGEVSFNGAFSFNAAVGYQFEQVRAELEVGNQFFSAKEFIPAVAGATAELVSGNITATTILLNGYYDIPTGSKLRPYIGGGIGLGFFRGDVKDNFGDSTNIDGSSFAWQAKAGIQYEVVRKGSIFAEVKYASAGGYTLKERVGTIYPELGSLNSFGVAIGYRQGF
ncbi:outer membrane protein [Cylindrospermopsis raciborskii]|jgi:opacity protein-like surface antigen|uniref:outer membrane protein n=1 Tax=Cylindrospermopsis raciborskii TaxID=77022 RepID=UPI001F32CDF2|nr:P44/Msp2 family outer membrane protein [Cylindrospermopsis raciborskii]UJS03406.1 P44/Msp2 family outer membrane protein [Cylindrospermopsis raciborskii KLL07]